MILIVGGYGVLAITCAVDYYRKSVLSTRTTLTICVSWLLRLWRGRHNLLHLQLSATTVAIIGYNICNPVCILPTLIPTVIHIYQHPMRHNPTRNQLYTQDTPVPVDNPTNPVDKVLIKLWISRGYQHPDRRNMWSVDKYPSY